jgi:hypothetical protein
MMSMFSHEVHSHELSFFFAPSASIVKSYEEFRENYDLAWVSESHLNPRRLRPYSKRSCSCCQRPFSPRPNAILLS